MESDSDECLYDTEEVEGGNILPMEIVQNQHPVADDSSNDEFMDETACSPIISKVGVPVSVSDNKNLPSANIASSALHSSPLATFISPKSSQSQAIRTLSGSYGGIIEANMNDDIHGITPQTVLTSTLKSDSEVLRDVYKKEKDVATTQFESWSEQEQVDFVQHLILRMCHYQHGQINAFLKPMLQRDFVTALPTRGLSHIAENILTYLDARSLGAAELVCREWYRVIQEGHLWKRLIERNVATDSLWKGLSERMGWGQYLFKGRPSENVPDSFFRSLYPSIIADIEKIESNWRCGRHDLKRIMCRSDNSKGVYCLQYDDEKIVSGLRDNTIKLWDRKTLANTKVLTGHTGSVLCLQYDDRVIITGSSDSTVRVWDVNTGEMVNTLVHHCEAVLHLRFDAGLMVTCSKDRSIAVWDMVSPKEINMRRVLVGHRAAVNVVDFDDTYIVSASGDRTIKVWNTSTCEFVRTLNGHKRGIACLQYRDGLVVSGSSDNTIRLWDIDAGSCLRVLEGHEELVRCIRFDNKRIVSGAYDGKIKVWDLKAAMDPRSPTSALCLRTLVEHTGRVFRLQFDEFQIISSSHDDSILIWDFLNVPESNNNELRFGKVTRFDNLAINAVAGVHV